MLDKKQLQVYLMFQHYKSEKRGDNPEQYNELLADIPTWAKNRKINNWYLWDKNEMEFADHLSLSEYLADTKSKPYLMKKPLKLVSCLESLLLEIKIKLRRWKSLF